ncbi:hypothetical protein B0H11DRAFT_2376494 [Mycena galericulata]|nr:hypothetical protein B0H11DRAFT_2376494 [Mycena galericulata]
MAIHRPALLRVYYWLRSFGPDYALPRPGPSPPTEPSTPTPRIAAPSEAAFTALFGALLPPAQFLTTPHGRTAFYDFPPPSPSSSPSRVILLHGICTPALGLLPLARALLTAHPHTHLVLSALYSRISTGANADCPVHLVGYSFGAATAAGYAALHPASIASLTLIAPAGLMRAESSFGARGAAYLPVRAGGDADYPAARDWVLQLLDGAPRITVPVDWEERVCRGSIVPEKVRAWQQEKHAGHVASVVAVFRDGGALDLHEAFAKGVRGVRSKDKEGVRGGGARRGAEDDVCSKEDLVAVGVQPENVVVVLDAGHGLVRERVWAVAVAGAIGRFWAGVGVGGGGG